MSGVVRQKDFSLLLLQRQDGKILFQLRTDNAPTYPSVWGFFGGAMESGESPEQAVMREAYEELHYECRNIELILHIPPDEIETPLNGHRYFFIETIDESQDLIQREGKGMDWFTLGEAEKLPTAPHNLEILPILRRHL